MPSAKSDASRDKLRKLPHGQGAERRRCGVIIGAAGVVVALAACGSSAPAKTGTTTSAAAGTAMSSATPGSAATSNQLLPAAVTGSPVRQAPPAKVANTTGIAGVIAYDTSGYPAPGTPSAGTLQHDHVTTPVTYAVTPPVGGDHNAIWMNAGVYTKPIPSERAVHNLEHGAVWITYQPNLPQSQVNQLVALVGKQSLIPESGQGFPAGQANRYVDLSPWGSQSLPSPIVISSWGYQLRVSSPTDPRLQQFIDTFRHSQKYTPEYGAPVDGVPTGTGGRAAIYGGVKPNPSGTVPG